MHAKPTSGTIMHAQYLDTLLDRATEDNSLIPQARRLIELRQILLEALSEPLAGLATVANYRQGKVIIFAANAAVAAKLKLRGPELADRFARRGLQVTAMEIEVQPGMSRPGLARKQIELSPAARHHLAELASQLPDSSLKNAVSALSTVDVSKR